MPAAYRLTNARPDEPHQRPTLIRSVSPKKRGRITSFLASGSRGSGAYRSVFPPVSIQIVHFRKAQERLWLVVAELDSGSVCDVPERPRILLVIVPLEAPRERPSEPRSTIKPEHARGNLTAQIPRSVLFFVRPQILAGPLQCSFPTMAASSWRSYNWVREVKLRGSQRQSALYPCCSAWTNPTAVPFSGKFLCFRRCSPFCRYERVAGTHLSQGTRPKSVRRYVPTYYLALQVYSRSLVGARSR